MFATHVDAQGMTVMHQSGPNFRNMNKTPKMSVKFITVESPSSTAANPMYIGRPQHQAIYKKSETYRLLSGKLGYPEATIAAAFKALAQVIKNTLDMAYISKLDGVASVRTNCQGQFATMSGPWVPGANMLVAGAVTLDPMKSALAGIIPENNTEGAKPFINSVYDTVTGIYDVITGTDLISIAGSDLAVDMTKSDEGVWLRNASGTETKLNTAESDLQIVKAALTTALTPGAYTLIVRTRSGLGEEYGVAEATRRVTVA